LPDACVEQVLGLLDAPQQAEGVAGGSRCLHPGAPLLRPSCCQRLASHSRLSLQVARTTGDPSLLVAGEQARLPVPGLLEQLDGRLGGPLRLFQLGSTNGEEAGQVQHHVAAPSQIGRVAHSRLHPAHRLHRNFGIGLRQVPHHPVRLPPHGVEHLVPARVALRQDLEEGVQDCQRLLVEATILGLAHRLTQHRHRLAVTDEGAAGEVGGGGCDAAGGVEGPSHGAVERLSPGGDHRLVHGLLDQRVGQLVAGSGPVWTFHQQRRPQQALEAVRHLFQGNGEDRRQLVGGSGLVDDAQQLQQGAVGGGQGTQLHRHPLSETLRDAVEVGFLQVRPFLQQRPQQADGEERMSQRPLDEPADERGGHRAGRRAEERRRQFADMGWLQGCQVEASQQAVVLQSDEDLAGDGFALQLGRSGG
jgi:hypothetical protein